MFFLRFHSRRDLAYGNAEELSARNMRLPYESMAELVFSNVFSVSEYLLRYCLGGDSIICIVKAGGIVCANVINVCTAFNTWLCNMVPTEELAARRDELSRAKSALYATRSRLENKLSTPKT